MARAPNTGTTLSHPGGENKTSTGLSTHILIQVPTNTQNLVVGAIQEITINESKDAGTIQELGTDGNIDSCPKSSGQVSGSCNRIRMEGHRLFEAFGRQYIHVASQQYPIDIVIVDRQYLSEANWVTTVIKNVWFKDINYTYSANDWVIKESASWLAETIYSFRGSASNSLSPTNATPVAGSGGEREDIKSVIRGLKQTGNVLEKQADTGLRRGAMDGSGLLDVIIF